MHGVCILDFDDSFLRDSGLVQVGHQEQLASFQVHWPHQVECLEYLLKSGKIRPCAMWRSQHSHAHDELCGYGMLCVCVRVYVHMHLVRYQPTSRCTKNS